MSSSHETSFSKAVSGEVVKSDSSGGHVQREATILTVPVLCRLRAMFATGSLLSLGLIFPPPKFFTVGKKVVYGMSDTTDGHSSVEVV